MKRYRVTGTRPVFGHPPGSEFERDIPPAQEARLLRGAIGPAVDHGGLDALTRADLDDLAAQLGHPNPSTFPNKSAAIAWIRSAD